MEFGRCARKGIGRRRGSVSHCFTLHQGGSLPIHNKFVLHADVNFNNLLEGMLRNLFTTLRTHTHLEHRSNKWNGDENEAIHLN